jgi:hypothetical protein
MPGKEKAHHRCKAGVQDAMKVHRMLVVCERLTPKLG